MKDHDALVIGGGFFGCMIALELRRLGLKRVILAEKQERIMQRATRFNQARVHRGYHYPRESITALRSAKNYRRFMDDFPAAVWSSFMAHYAIARNSRVTPTQFEHFCKNTCIPFRSAAPDIKNLFNPNLVQDIYRVEETVFNCELLAFEMQNRIEKAGIDLALRTEVSNLQAKGSGCQFLLNQQKAQASLVFNATYSAIDHLGIALQHPIKREWAEVTLIKLPEVLAATGITVMDGPFFSVMPFPGSGHHTLTHVRYTPIASWINPKDEPLGLKFGVGESMRGEIMQRDAARYIPILRHARILGAFYEIKAVLAATEQNDGRPVLFEQARDLPIVYSVLGAKIDNIYDVLEDVSALVGGIDPHSVEKMEQYYDESA